MGLWINLPLSQTVPRAPGIPELVGGMGISPILCGEGKECQIYDLLGKGTE